MKISLKSIIITVIALLAVISLFFMSILSVSTYGIDVGFSLMDLLDLPAAAEVGGTVAFTFIAIIVTVIIGVLAITQRGKIAVMAASVAGVLSSLIAMICTPEGTSGGAGLWVALICCIITAVLSAIEIPVLDNKIDQYTNR